MTNEILNIKEVAELLRLAEKTVYSMAQTGELPALRSVGSGAFAAPTSTPGSRRSAERREGSDGTCTTRRGLPPHRRE